jgi:hypothetical protein
MKGANDIMGKPTKARALRSDDLDGHPPLSMIDHMDHAHLLNAVRLIPAAQGLSDGDILSMVGVALLASRYQGWGWGSGGWVGEISGDKESLATRWDR